MSVAFRRESDEEHKEPRFEVPIPAGPNLVTAAGLRAIERQVAELDAAVAAAYDDAAREPLRRQLRYWATRHATAEVPPAPPADTVAFGSRVRFRLAGQERVVDIVGTDEADPRTGRLAFNAPLARALIGLEAGEVADFGGTPDAIEIREVGPIPSPAD